MTEAEAFSPAGGYHCSLPPMNVARSWHTQNAFGEGTYVCIYKVIIQSLSFQIKYWCVVEKVLIHRLKQILPIPVKFSSMELGV